jgi:hypothetical protein
MADLFHLFRGSCYGRRIFLEVVLKEWDKVFTGTKSECLTFQNDNPLGEDQCYQVIPFHLIQSDRKPRNIRYKARVVAIDRMMSPGGLHQTIVPPGKSRKWLFKLRMSNGTEGTAKFDQPIPKLQNGDNVIYEVKLVKREPVIIIKDIL